MKYLLFCLLTWIVLAGCDRKPPESASTQASAGAAIPLGITAKCLLCVDHEIEVTNQTPTSLYEGEQYYFCSKSCKKRFDRDPALALAKRPPATKPAD